RDVTPGDHDANPTSTTFSVGDDFTFSPDGTHLLFTAPPIVNEAWSTNYDIWRAPIDGSARPKNVTQDNRAADGTPRFSPDGRHLAYRGQRRPGDEADRWELVVAACDPSGALQEKPKSITANFDSGVEEFVWFPKSDGLLFAAEKNGDTAIWSLKLGAD